MREDFEFLPSRKELIKPFLNFQFLIIKRGKNSRNNNALSQISTEASNRFSLVEDRLNDFKKFVTCNGRSNIVCAPPKIEVRVGMVFVREPILEAG